MSPIDNDQSPNIHLFRNSLLQGLNKSCEIICHVMCRVCDKYTLKSVCKKSKRQIHSRAFHANIFTLSVLCHRWTGIRADTVNYKFNYAVCIRISLKGSYNRGITQR